MNTLIRKMGESDLAVVVDLMHDFAAFEKLSKYCEITAERLRTAMFESAGFVNGLVACDGGDTVAYALFYPNFSSFRGQRGLYLEDIYIKSECRGKGLGEAMLHQIARIAASRGFERIDFMVLDWNAAAVKFYNKLGAIRDDDERHFKFTDDAFRQLAS